jgi:hypothetical protein
LRLLGFQVVVEEMNILTTIFLRYDNLKVYYPNSQLAILPIMNYYRSPDMGDAVDFSVNVATTAEKLALMKERLMQYVPCLLPHFHSYPVVTLNFVELNLSFQISVTSTTRKNIGTLVPWSSFVTSMIQTD